MERLFQHVTAASKATLECSATEIQPNSRSSPPPTRTVYSPDEAVEVFTTPSPTSTQDIRLLMLDDKEQHALDRKRTFIPILPDDIEEEDDFLQREKSNFTRWDDDDEYNEDDNEELVGLAFVDDGDTEMDFEDDEHCIQRL
jgi:hypothetical protein